MKKGFTALEMVFMIFILIVVVLVVIRMFTQVVSPKKIEHIISNYEENRKFLEMKEKCKMMCEDYISAAPDEKLFFAYRWCTQKIVDKGRKGFDINEDGVYDGAVLIGDYPYCEDGLYCFLFFDCRDLNIKKCAEVACKYHYVKTGDIDTATDYVSSTREDGGIFDVGKCNMDALAEEAEREGIFIPEDYLDNEWWFEKYFGDVDCSSLIGVSGEEE